MIIQVKDWLTDNVVSISIEDAAGFKIGQRVKHANGGLIGGSSGVITKAAGTIQSLEYHGTDIMGAGCFTALVNWDCGQSYSLRTSLLLRKI